MVKYLVLLFYKYDYNDVIEAFDVFFLHSGCRFFFIGTQTVIVNSARMAERVELPHRIVRCRRRHRLQSPSIVRCQSVSQSVSLVIHSNIYRPTHKLCVVSCVYLYFYRHWGKQIMKLHCMLCYIILLYATINGWKPHTPNSKYCFVSLRLTYCTSLFILCIFYF